MRALKATLIQSRFGRSIAWQEVGSSLVGEVASAVGLVLISIIKSPSSEQLVVLDGGTIKRLINKITLDSMPGWHLRNDVLYVECERDGVVNAVRDLVQLLEESALCEHVRPTLRNDADMRLVA
jgi:hypothetical protein